MNFNVVVFALGCAGGVIAEAYRWFSLRESPDLPVYAKSILYWVVTVVMVLVGGALASVYGISPDNPLLAVNVGISAPLILKSLVQVVPQPQQRQLAQLESVVSKPSLRRFFG